MNTSQKTLSDRVRNYLELIIVIGIISLFFLSIGVLFLQYGFFAVKNEIGSLGMDKYGRQVFIQNLDKFTSQVDEGLKVTSEYDDYNFLQKAWQEPMRTTLRIVYNADEEKALNIQINSVLDPDQSITTRMYEFLESPASLFIEFITESEGEMTLTDRFSISGEQLEDLALQNDIKNMEELLRGFGFRKYEAYINDDEIQSFELLPEETNLVVREFVSRGE